MEVLRGPPPENIRSADRRTIDLLAVKRRGTRCPSLFEFWPPARLQIAIHVHRAADIDIVRKKRHRGVARIVEPPRSDPDTIHGHAGLQQSFDSVVVAACIDHAIISIYSRVSPAFHMGRLVQRNGVNGDLHGQVIFSGICCRSFGVCELPPIRPRASRGVNHNGCQRTLFCRTVPQARSHQRYLLTAHFHAREFPEAATW